MSFFDVDGISKRMFSLLFILKVIFGVSLWAIYTFYYTDRATADIYKYFDDSEVIFNTLKTNPIDYFKLLFGIGNNTPAFDHYYTEMNYWARKVDSSIYNDSHTIIRFNALVRLFSFGYYNVHTVVICFLSLIGLTAIYKTFVNQLLDKKRELLFAVFLLPSVLFWGSGVLKEGLILFALGLLIYYSDKLFSKKAILICIATALLLAFSKFYVWLAIFPSIALLVWSNKATTPPAFIKLVIILSIIGVLGLNIDSFTSIQNPLVTLSQKQYEFNLLATGQLTDSNHNPIPTANSLIEINRLDPTFSSFLKNGPQALTNTFLRPFIWELKSPLMLLSGLETIFILFIFITSLLFLKPFKEICWQLFLFCISFVFIQFLIIGETTPILGAIARYKTIALPFFLIALLFILDKKKLVNKLPFLKKILN
ncbi:MAG: hypothetical protein IPP64_12550 [Bacteroidetes bacterium]|nr:hypothetical protein [Bacteroidota bacterium]